MTQDDMAQRLELLRVEHRDLDGAIVALQSVATPDLLAIARLKKRKLLMRDEMAWLQNQMVPDIIA